MKKFWLLVGAVIGFVLGSRAGREPYERLEFKARQVSRHPAVKSAVQRTSDQISDLTDNAVNSAAEKVSDVGDKVSDLTHRTDTKTPSHAVVAPHEPTKDPQDKAFGAAASRDQDAVDELEKQGVTEEELPDEPTQHPRSGGKAKPA